MSTETPPASDDLNGPTSELQGWTRDGDTVLTAKKTDLAQWLDTVRTAANQLDAQLAIARGLVINEGVVGSFTSAKMTASGLNQTGDAIRQRLTESAEFVNALRDYSEAAFNKLYAQDGQ